MIRPYAFGSIGASLAGCFREALTGIHIVHANEVCKTCAWHDATSLFFAVDIKSANCNETGNKVRPASSRGS